MTTEVGPLCTQRQRDHIHRLIEASLSPKVQPW